MALYKSPSPVVRNFSVPSTSISTDTSGCDSASRAAAATQAAASLPSRLRNFRRAGVLKNRSSTSTVVPTGQPTSVSLLCPSQISKR